MADNYNEQLIRLGVTGGMFVAPTGTISPIGMEAYGPDFVDLGWISDEGINEAVEEDKSSWTPWQSQTEVREEVLKTSLTWETTLWTTSFDTVSVYFRKSADEMEEEDGVVSFTDGGPAKKDQRFFGMDVIDGVYARRILVPNGSISERGGQVYRKEELIGYPITMKAGLTAQGWSCKRLFKEGWSLPTPAGP